MKRLLVGLIFTLTLLPSQTLAQFGAYTTNGVGVDGSVRSADSTTTLRVRVGYVLPAPFEVGVSLSRCRADGVDFTTTGVGPYVAFYPIRESQGYPFSIVLDANYDYLRFTGAVADEIKREGGSGTGNAFSFGTGFFPVLEVSDALRLVPYLGIRFRVRSRAQESAPSQETTSIDARLPLQIHLTSGASVAVVPSASLGDNDTNRFGLSVALVFGE